MISNMLVDAGMNFGTPPRFGGSFSKDASPREIPESVATTRELAAALSPGLGDVVGPAQDIGMFLTDPSSRTPLNFGLAAAGALPFVPSIGSIKRLTRYSPGTGKPVSVDFQPARGGQKIGHYKEAAKEQGMNLSDAEAAALREDHRELKALRSKRAALQMESRDPILRRPFGSKGLDYKLKDKRLGAENKIKRESRKAYVNQEKSKILNQINNSSYNKSFSDEALGWAEMGEVDYARRALTRANLEAVPRLLKKQGWTMRHASTAKSGKKTSRYLVSPDKKFEVRLSDHFLPDTPERLERGGGVRWDMDLVVSGRDTPEEIIESITSEYKRGIE